ncbi:MAG TPA: hypothetical protein VFW11_05405, partial [Cyclobacteriaceae bacterium]|nr:hypothetical protein [Cyclobacteriaceae bacterium]
YIYLFLFLLFAISASAQSEVVWVWKDVQKYSNSDNLAVLNFTVTSLGYPAWIISKGVQSGNGNESVAGNIVSQGYPYWTISKDVQRNLLQPGAVKPKAPSREPAIANNLSITESILK